MDSGYRVNVPSLPTREVFTITCRVPSLLSASAKTWTSGLPAPLSVDTPDSDTLPRIDPEAETT